MAARSHITKFTPNRHGIGALLVGPEVGQMIARKTQLVAAAAGPGMQYQVYIGRDRWRGMVWTATREARVAEATQRRLSRAFGGAGYGG